MRTVPLLLAFTAAISSAQRQLVPVPDDPHELAKGAIQVLSSTQDRAAIASMVHRSSAGFAFHTPNAAPYAFHASFTASGPWAEQGQGQIEEIWANGQQWRWSANVGGYSQMRIFSKGIAYDDKQVMMAMPVQLLRTAIFNPVHNIGANMEIRSITTSLNGLEVTCGLFTNGSVEPTDTPTRRWAETEYCVDPKSNLLQTYSDAPGIYVVYDYSSPLSFHGRTIPGGIAIFENNTKVIDAKLSIADTDPNQAAVFTPTQQMISGGPGAIAAGLQHFTRLLPAAGMSPDARIQPTIVHASIGPDGKVREAIALQSTNLSAQAVEAVKQLNLGRMSSPDQIPYQRQAFINVQFVPPGTNTVGSAQ